MTKKKSRPKKPFKSKLEETFSELAKASLGIKVPYENDSLEWIQPASKHRYTPDFKLREKVFVECKGKLTLEDRKKLLHVAQQHLDITIYLVFGRSGNKLRKGSPTTYGQWATANGFEWDDIEQIKKRGFKKSWL